MTFWKEIEADLYGIADEEYEAQKEGRLTNATPLIDAVLVKLKKQMGSFHCQNCLNSGADGDHDDCVLDPRKG